MTEAELLTLLKNVAYPGFSRDIVSFGLVQKANFTEGKASVVLEVSSGDSTLPLTIKQAAEKELLNHSAIEEAEVVVRTKGGAQKAQSTSEANLAGVKRILAIASGKGGVGKSTLTANLACSLVRKKNLDGETLKIGVMDCDLYGPSIPLLLGASDRPELVGDNILAPVESYDVKCISMGLLIDEDSPVVWRGPMIMKTIQQFAENVKWGELDYLLIDLPPGTGDAQLSLAQVLPLDGALIITTPQKAAVDVARRGARMFEKVNVPLVGVVENMSYLVEPSSGERRYLFGQGGGSTTAHALRIPFLGEVPLDEEVRQGGDHGTPVVVVNPENPSSLAFSGIAQKVLDLLPAE